MSYSSWTNWDFQGPDDPTVAPGVPAPLGTVYRRVPTTGTPTSYLYLKVGNGNTEWALTSDTPRTIATYFQDFVEIAGIFNNSANEGGDANSIPWDDNADSYPETNVMGLIAMAIGPQVSVAANVAAWTCGDGAFSVVLGHGRFETEWRAAVNQALPGGATAFFFTFGVGQNFSGETTPGLRFVVDEQNLGNSNWWATVGDYNAAGQAIDTGVAVQVNALHRFKVVYDSNLGIPSALFYIDDVLVATFTANLPSAQGGSLGAKMAATLPTVNGSARFDYAAMTYEFDNPR